MRRRARAGRASRLAGVALALGALACSGPSAAPKGGAASEQEGAPKPTKALPAPVVEGSVQLAEGAELPAFLAEEMERKVLTQTERAAWPEACTPPKILDRSPMRMGDGRELSNVVVAASGFSRHATRAPKVHEVAIRDCRLTPSVVVAMKGDTLRITNEVSYPFMPAYGKIEALRTLSPGQTYDVPLEPGVGVVSCGFTAPCGRTDVVVLQHPLATLTDEQGKFRLEGFEAEEQVTISAWHPLLKESEVGVDLERGEPKRVELSVTPLVRAPAATPGEQPKEAPAATPGEAPTSTAKPAGEKPAPAEAK